MISLKQARKKKKVDQFIREHEADELGDLETLDKALKHPVSQKSKEAPKSSSRDNRGD